ncbi:MAG: HAMP domain-containing protein, partial [bacterium]
MRLLWRMYFSFFACTLLALALTSWYGNYSFRSFYQKQISADLLKKANVLASELASPFAASEWDQVARRCKEFGRLTQTRVTVILPDGRVIGESEQEPSQMENHKNRPEIADALMGKTGKAVRFSDTIRRTSLYLAIPVYQDGAVVGVVRTSLPLAVIEWSLRSVFWHAAVGALMVAAFFAIVSFHLARRMTQPLDEMRRTAERLARGDLKARVPLLRGPEMASFAHTLNQMASQLSERMDTITLQSDQQKAVFASMAEGVLAVDSDGRVLDLNLSAAQLLDLRPEQVRGLSIQEAVRNVDLQKFVTATLAAGELTETEIILYGNTERFLQLHGTTLRVPEGKNPGALIVLN